MNLDGYVTVAQRLAMALEKWPELRVTELPPKIVTVGDSTYIEVTTTVWRTPDDPIPAQASCWEVWPGKTPFTRDSEQPNASTSALGRCLGLMGVAVDKALASADEVELRKALDSDEGPPVAVKRSKPSRTPAETVQDAFPGAEVQDTGKTRRKAPTEKMTNYLKALAAKADVPVTQEQLNDFDLCRARIEELKAS